MKKQKSARNQAPKTTFLEAHKELKTKAFIFLVLLYFSKPKILKKEKNKIFKRFGFSKSAGYRAIGELISNGFLEERKFEEGSKVKLVMKRKIEVDNFENFICSNLDENLNWDCFVSEQNPIEFIEKLSEAGKQGAHAGKIFRDSVNKNLKVEGELIPKNGKLDSQKRESQKRESQKTSKNQRVRKKNAISENGSNSGASILFLTNNNINNNITSGDHDKTRSRIKQQEQDHGSVIEVGKDQQQDHDQETKVGKEKEKIIKKEKEKQQDHEVGKENKRDKHRKFKIGNYIDLDKMKRKHKESKIRKNPEKKKINWDNLRKLEPDFQSLCSLKSKGRAEALNILAAKKTKKRREFVKEIGESFATIYTSYRLMVQRERGNSQSYIFCDSEYKYAELIAMTCLEKGCAPWILLQYWHTNIKDFKGHHMNIPPLSLLSNAGMIDQVVCSNLEENLKSGNSPDFDVRIKKQSDKMKEYNPAIKRFLLKNGFDVRSKTDREILNIQLWAKDRARGFNYEGPDPSLEEMIDIVSKNFFK